jgi:hypothetical protein
MADDERPEPVPAPAPEPEPEAAASPEVPDVATLQAELEEAKHAKQLYEETLASLTTARAPAAPSSTAPPVGGGGAYNDPVVGSIGLARSDVERIKQEAGLSSDEEVAAAVRWARPIMEAIAKPLVGYIASLADIADRHEARLSVEGYADLQEEVEKEVANMRARGSHLPRTELAQIARAKKLPKLLEKEAAGKKAAKVEAASARRATADNDTSLAKVGPTAGGRATPSLDQIKGLSSREERIKALEEAAGNRTF